MPYIGNVLTSFAVETGNINDQAITSPKLSATGGTDGQVLALDSNGDLVWSSDPAGQWVTSGDDIYYTTGNIGIGLSSSVSSLLHLRNNDATAFDATDTDGQVGVGPTIYLENPANANNTVGGQIVFGMRGTEEQARISATGGTSPELVFITADAQRMVIDNSGNVGIGVTSPGSKLHLSGGAENVLLETTNSSGDAFFGIRNGSYGVLGTGDAYIYRDGGDIALLADGSTDVIKFASGGNTEQMRIDSSGRLLVGTTSSYGIADQVQIVSDTGVNLHRGSSNTGAARLDLSKSRNTTYGSNTIVESGDTLGSIIFRGDDGTDYTTPGGEIKVEVDGTPDADEMPGRLVFSTNTGTTTVTERMRIDSSGRVGIGTGTTPGATLEVVDGTTTDGPGAELRLSSRDQSIAAADEVIGSLTFKANDASTDQTGVFAKIDAASNRLFDGDNASGLNLRFFAGDKGDGVNTPPERMRITTEGRVGIGTTSPGSIVDIRQTQTGGETRLRIFNTDNSDTDTQTASIGLSPDSRATATAGIEAIKVNTDFSTNAGRDVALALNTTLNNAKNQAVYINHVGNVGIGTTGPARGLTNASDVTLTTGTAPQYRLNGTAADDTDADRAIFGLATAADQFFNTAEIGDAVLRTTDGGNLLFGEGTTERMRIDSAGRLLVGRTSNLQSSSERFTVDGGISVMRNSSANNGTLHLRNEDDTASTNQPYIVLTDGSGNRGGIGVVNDSSAMWLSGQTGIRFRGGSSSPGNTEFGRFDTDGLKFNGDTAAANALDDYEEGTHNTTVTMAGDTSFSYTNRTLAYTKIGRVVHLTGRLFLSGCGGTSFNFTLPFDCADGVQFETSNEFQNIRFNDGYTFRITSNSGIAQLQDDGTTTGVGVDNPHINVNLTYFTDV